MTTSLKIKVATLIGYVALSALLVVQADLAPAPAWRLYLGGAAQH